MSMIERFMIDIPQADIEDLHRRLDATRWPDRETVDDWSQGVPLARIKALCDYWRTGHDWRRCEARLNDIGNYRTEIDGLPIHFLHVRSPNPDALPLLITHGWPGSVIEFLKVIGPLTDPARHGADARDSFHLVIPSLPGFGFSGRPTRTGWGIPRIAEAWVELMNRLGYQDRWVAQGGDWGTAIATQLGIIAPKGLEAIHLNLLFAVPDVENRANWSEEEKAAAKQSEKFDKDGVGYSRLQQTRPQTLGYGLADSPAGQAAWIYEKFYEWTDCQGAPENVLSQDEMLDNISLYWLTDTGASSARLYWESLSYFRGGFSVDVPTGASIFPREIIKTPRRWAERNYRNIIYWNELDRGGHFAAFEQPALYIEEVRACFRPYRSRA